MEEGSLATVFFLSSPEPKPAPEAEIVELEGVLTFVVVVVVVEDEEVFFFWEKGTSVEEGENKAEKLVGARGLGVFITPSPPDDEEEGVFEEEGVLMRG